MKQRPYTDAVASAEQRLSRTELENSRKLNPNLQFIPNHPSEPALRSILAALIAALDADGVPKGFRPPIAAGSKRAATSYRTAETLLANILRLPQCDADTLALTQQHDAYSKTALSGTGLINLVRLGDLRELWKLYPGFRGKHVSRLARLYPRRKFHRLVEATLADGIGIEDSFYHQPDQLVLLRDSDGNDIPPENWTLTPEQQSKVALLGNCLQWFNLVLSEYQMSTAARRLYPVLYAVYKGSFAHGGRFYTARGGHTNLSKAERRTLTFNGHPTVELDFQGLHIRMLYHFAGAEFPLRSDPYASVLGKLGLQPETVFREFPSVRDDLKDMLLAFINGKATEKEQIARANRRLFYGQSPAKQDRAEKRKGRWAKVGLLKLDDRDKPTAAHVIHAFKAAHQPIGTQFNTGCGLQLQNLDAEIARWVLLEMMVSNGDECIPTLPVHDSFITFAEFEAKLRRAMLDAYQFVVRQQTKRADHRYSIPIKRG